MHAISSHDNSFGDFAELDYKKEPMQTPYKQERCLYFKAKWPHSVINSGRLVLQHAPEIQILFSD